jgi:hypothetical protein
MFDKRLRLGGISKDRLPRNYQSYIYIPDTACEIFALFMESVKSFIFSISYRSRVAWQ